MRVAARECTRQADREKLFGKTAEHKLGTAAVGSPTSFHWTDSNDNSLKLRTVGGWGGAEMNWIVLIPIQCVLYPLDDVQLNYVSRSELDRFYVNLRRYVRYVFNKVLYC